MKTTLHTGDAKQTADEQALEWLVRLQSGEFKPEDEQALRAWLDASVTHQRAFDNAASLWKDVGLTDELIFAAENSAEPVRHKVRSPSFLQSGIAMCSTWLRAMCRPLANPVAAISMMLLIGFATLIPGVFEPTPDRYRSGYAENRQILLEDGSVVTLSGRSEISVLLTRARRNIELLQGAAHFEVARDPHRPFVVSALDVEVRAVGTAFEVRSSDKVRVSVDEGLVNVVATASNTRLVKSLGQGQRITFSADTLFSAVQPYEYEHALQWRTGRLDYRGEALAEVLKDVNRYRKTPIVLAEQKLAGLQITASFRIDESDALIEGLLVTHDLRVEHRAGRILLFQQ
ncbi:FecR family protein [Lacimicrobium alkaliphilum]|uniref:Sensor n=1 Tax=Lacimicrobium alkaliphilum TaxID=1526571 RepID=A0ABQ1RIJ2_9ALTE|nr:FecR domain-containing protein [Lacimicrobium alkaliphilum]GGD69451.1 sensor [Lacimicrobium alkaliphilum]